MIGTSLRLIIRSGTIRARAYDGDGRISILIRRLPEILLESRTILATIFPDRSRWNDDAGKKIEHSCT